MTGYGGAGNLAQVRAYYDSTWLDYRVLWLNPCDRALHFGYWDERAHSHAASLIRMNEVLAERVGVQRGQRVLDAGCGVGGTLIWLARRYGVHGVGITPVASQVARARRYAREQGVDDRVSFEQQDFTRTTFPDASFDILLALESACHAPDKRRFLAEARRLLRPGGGLGVNEYMQTGHPRGEQDWCLMNSWLEGWAIPNLASGAEWTGMARRAGFAGVELRDLTAQVRPSLQRLFRLAGLTWAVAGACRALGWRSAMQQGNVRAARDQYRALEGGLWFYGMLTARAGEQIG